MSGTALTPEQEKNVQAQKDRIEELNRQAGDSTLPQLDRIEAQNKLLGLSIRSVAAQGGLTGGLKDVLKAAGPQLEQAQQAFREIMASVAVVEARVARLETNVKTFIEKSGGTYQ